MRSQKGSALHYRALLLAGHGKKLNFYSFDGKTLAGLEQGNEVLLIKEAALGRIGCCWESEWRQRN